MKKTENYKILLITIFVVSIVISNIVGCKVIDLGFSMFGIPMLLGGGALTYAFTFLCTDVIGELWGKKDAGTAVVFGFVAQIFAIALVIVIQHTPAYDPNIQSAYEILLGSSPIFVVGSLSAYICSQKWDVFIFHHLRDKFNADPRKRWIWNNASTITSQIIDTFIYAFISFGIGCGLLFEEGGLNQMFGIFIGQYFLKVGLAVIDTPFFYLLTARTSTN